MIAPKVAGHFEPFPPMSIIPSRLFPFKKKIQAKGERITVEKFARLPLIKKQALTYTL